MRYLARLIARLMGRQTRRGLDGQYYYPRRR